MKRIREIIEWIRWSRSLRTERNEIMRQEEAGRDEGAVTLCARWERLTQIESQLSAF